MAALSLLTDILRIITPEEISELTTAYTGNTRVELTDLLEHVESGKPLEYDTEGDSAKILPFMRDKVGNDKTSLGEDLPTLCAGDGVVEYITHYLHKLEIGSTACRNSGEAVETSVFILNEKERFKYVQEKLKKKEIMGLYMKNAGVDIEQEKTLKDDLSKSSQSGVLIDKKQY